MYSQSGVKDHWQQAWEVTEELFADPTANHVHGHKELSIQHDSLSVAEACLLSWNHCFITANCRESLLRSHSKNATEKQNWGNPEEHTA